MKKFLNFVIILILLLSTNVFAETQIWLEPSLNPGEILGSQEMADEYNSGNAAIVIDWLPEFWWQRDGSLDFMAGDCPMLCFFYYDLWPHKTFKYTPYVSECRDMLENPTFIFTEPFPDTDNDGIPDKDDLDSMETIDIDLGEYCD